MTMKTKLKCAQSGCVTNSLPASEKCALFCFPRDDINRRKWIAAIDRADLSDRTYNQLRDRGIRVCALHFDETQFQTFEKKKLNFRQIPISVFSTRLVEPVALKDFGGTQVKQLSLKKERLNLRLQKTERLLTLSRKRGRQLLQKCTRNKVDVLSSSSVHNIENIYSLPGVLLIFVLSMLRNFHQTKKSRPYTLNDKSLFLSIFNHSPNCFQYLQKLLSIPSVETLQRSLPTFKLNVGINDKLFEYLNNISRGMSPMELCCTLMFGEMQISQSLNLSISPDTWRVEGFVDSGTERSQTLANRVLVFMIRGIGRKWKQAIAFYFTHNSADKQTLISLIKEVVQTVHNKTKFKIVASVCDGESKNVAAMRSLSAESDLGEFVYRIDGRQIVHLFDAPYLLKCVRNNLITNNIEFHGKVAKWADMEQLYKLDAVGRTLKATKLTDAHIQPTSRQKRKFKLAAQTLSQSNAGFLLILTKTKTVDAMGTSIFVKFMNELFDSLNSVTDSTTPLQSRLTKNSVHFSFWAEAVQSLKSMKFFVGDERVENPPCIQLFLVTIANVQRLWKYLRNHRFRFLTLRSLNQDPIEHLFSVTRGLSGNAKPSASQFIDAYNATVFNSTVKFNVDRYCEDDVENPLITYQLLLSNSSSTTTVNPFASTSSHVATLDAT